MNLLLIGRAHSNVFNGTEIVAGGGGEGAEDLALRGIPSRAAVGFLSLFEAFGYLRVGDFYKLPSVPIWVVSSESHYSVLLAAPRGAVWPTECYEPSRVAAARRRLAYIEPSDSLAVGLASLRSIGSSSDDCRPVDLIYFDSLGRQEAVCRLTVSLSSAVRRGAPADDDPPPIEAVIRTLWPGATVSWNGTDPIL